MILDRGADGDVSGWRTLVSPGDPAGPRHARARPSPSAAEQRETMRLALRHNPLALCAPPVGCRIAPVTLSSCSVRCRNWHLASIRSQVARLRWADFPPPIVMRGMSRQSWCAVSLASRPPPVRPGLCVVVSSVVGSRGARAAQATDQRGGPRARPVVRRGAGGWPECSRKCVGQPAEACYDKPLPAEASAHPAAVDKPPAPVDAPAQAAGGGRDGTLTGEE